ncbi:MAG TPA: Smr/MutS family protein, partial [Sphingobium sp.]|nr:Smr/MutS family protein [Sphingobium sp.]
MARRHLSSDEQAIWNALTRSVHPLRPQSPAEAHAEWPVPISKGRSLTPQPSRPIDVAPARTPTTVLDASWERRIRGGTLAPDMTIDLHGHSLSSAHARLNHALSTALTRDQRVLLIITGKPPK